MADYTSSQTGNWNTSSTWGDAGVPGDGDTVTLANGYTVTIPSGYTAVVGTSPDDDVSTPAIQCSGSTGTGILIINGTLRFRGTIKQANATWVANAGAVIEHDSSQATTPSNTHYTWQIGMAENQANAVLQLAGTGAGSDRVIVQNATNSGRFGGWHGGQTGRNGASYPSGGYGGSGRIDADYTTFDGLGVSGVEFITAKLNYTGNALTFDNCIIDDCTVINVLPSINGAAVFREKNTSFLNPVNTDSHRVWFQQALTTGERLIENCIIEGRYTFVYGLSVTAKKTAFIGTSGAAPLYGGSVRIHFAEFSDCFVYVQSGSSTMPCGAMMTNLVSLAKAGSSDQDHFRMSGSFGYGGGVNGCVAEFNGTSDDGDVFVFESNPSSVLNYEVKNVLLLPNADGGSSGSLAILVGSGGSSTSNYRLTVDNNTVIGSISQVFLNEATSLGDNVVQSIRNNLIANSSSLAGYIQKESVTAPDSGSIVVADYNCLHNVSTTDVYESADSVYDSTPGTNDISANPEFVDDTRDFLSWGQTIDADITTWAEIWAEIRQMNNDSGYDSSFDWADFYTWAREGFAPTNTDLQAVGYDGSDIGAITVFTGSTLSPVNLNGTPTTNQITWTWQAGS